jgi:signal transduction histidine kinase
VTPAKRELRSSGIVSVGDIPWGTHFCHFYETTEDLLDVMIPYFKTGLDNNEFCMWIVYEPVTAVDAHEALRKSIPEFDRRQAAGDIVILPHSECYLHEGVFDSKRVIAGWKERLTRAYAAGYTGVRANGNRAWVSRKDLGNFMQYENEINRMLLTERMLVLCTYPLAARTGSEVFDVARPHEFAITRRHGSWQELESPQFRKAKEELKAHTEQLENRVVERTLELQEVNERLRALSDRLQSAREDEGTRIAREIHDQIGSALTSLKWDLEGLERAVAENRNLSEPAELRRRMVSMMGLTDQTLETVRRIASELRPSILDDLGLVEAVEWQAKQFHTHAGIPCHCRCSLEEADLDPEQSTNLFRILQEALTNVVRHAHATAVDIVLERQAANLVLTVRDNGVGITSAQASSPNALGLLGMRERARTAGGTIDISGAGGKGAAVVVQVPLFRKYE